MNDTEIILKEYDTLRTEINEKIALHNSLITFMITTVVAILAFSITENIPWLYLLPFCIIIPISMRVAYYRSVMTKISAYLSVYIENTILALNWETRNTNINNNIKGKFYDKITISHYYEGLLLSLVCYIMYSISYISTYGFHCSLIFALGLPFLLVVWESIITKRIADFNNEKNEWIKTWTSHNAHSKRKKTLKRKSNKPCIHSTGK